MKFDRHFTSEDIDPSSYTEWKYVDASIKDHATGEVKFKLDNAEIPSDFNSLSETIITSKYFRLTLVPHETVKIPEQNKFGMDVPEWLQRSEPIAEAKEALKARFDIKKKIDNVSNKNPDNEKYVELKKELEKIESSINFFYGAENSAKQVFHRLAGFWAYHGFMDGYFDNEESARGFYDELFYMLSHQMCAPNTPQWFNSGVYWAYGIEIPTKGLWRAGDNGKASITPNYYQYPGLHACHILGVNDSLFEDSGVYDNIAIEAKAFATGGGVGKNISNIRSKFEDLSNGNKSSGSHQFALVDDRSAGVIKSGSAQRRAAKMVIRDIDDPEVPEFVNWKSDEEKKVDALIAAGYPSHYESEAYKTVSGQNSNNSIRVTEDFLNAVEENSDWEMTARTTGEVVRKMNARKLWKDVCESAWRSADPGIQFESLINDWNTCINDGRIRASNPCSEYFFLDNTSCNLASINLSKFFPDDFPNEPFKVDDFIFACNTWMMVLDISAGNAQLPSKALAEGTAKYRTTGLGHTDIGSVLMKAGIPYDSPKACHLVAAVSSLMTACCYNTSGKMASAIGPFPRYKHNKESMLRVMKNHVEASSGSLSTYKDYDGLTVEPWEIDHGYLQQDFSDAIISTWAEAYAAGRDGDGYRNAFVTVIQPSGTVGLLMGCDTLAIEPDYSLIKYKSLSGGGSVKIVNNSVEKALENLGYTEKQIDDILVYMLGNNTLDGAPKINSETLVERGVTADNVAAIERELSSCTQLNYAISHFAFSDESKSNLGLTDKDSDQNIFTILGFTQSDYIEANKWVCGHGTVEGAPHVKNEHYAIFETANRSGYGSRYIRPDAHVAMMSAVSPFISGGISKTVNLPNDATVEDIDKIYMMSHHGEGYDGYMPGGIKCIALYRDGCKRSQPLTNSADMSWWTTNKNEESVYMRGDRKKPKSRRNMWAQEVRINGQSGSHKIIIKFGEYDDGKLSEIWVDVTKDNPSFYLAMKWFTRQLSNALQYGQPLEEIAESFIGEEGGPNGMTDHPHIKFCKSIPDLVMKIAMLEYSGDTTYVSGRKPRVDQVRCGMIKNGNVQSSSHHNNDVKLSNKSVATISEDDSKCPLCGGRIIKEPCPTCSKCGTSFGGCA